MSWRDRAVIDDGKTPKTSWRDRAKPADGGVSIDRSEASKAGQAALEHFANAATLGYLPQIQALSDYITPDPNADLDQRLKAEGFSIDEGDKGYIASRDRNLKRLAKQEQENPLSSLAGTGAGILTTALIPMSAASKGASLAEKAYMGAKGGAKLGLAVNPGDTEGDFSPVQLGDRLSNAAKGAAFGAAVPVAVAGAGKVGKYLGEKAAKKATRALGRPTPTTAQKMSKSGQDIALGRELLDEKAIPILGTPARIAKRVNKLKERAGKDIGDLIDSVGAPESVDAKKLASSIRNSPELREMAKTPGMSMAVNKIRAQADAIAKKGVIPFSEARDIARNLERGGTFRSAQKEIDALIQSAGGNKVIDAKMIAKKILGSEEFKEMQSIPGMESTVAAIQRQADTLKRNGFITLKEAQKLRQGIDRSINFNKAAPDMRGAQEGLYQQRTAIRDAMNEGINALPKNAPKDALLKANRRYANMSQASDILEKEIARNQTNRAVSLTDTISGGSGAVIGGMLGGPAGATAGAVTGAALNKFGRAFGNTMQARGYNAAGKAASAVGRMSPGAASALGARVGTMTPGMQGDPEPILKNSRLLDLFREDPSLIDLIEDVGVRSKVRKKLGIDKNQKKLTAQDRWAHSGAKKLGLSDDEVARAMKSKRGKRLLIEASDLRQDGRRMEKLREQLRKEME